MFRRLLIILLPVCLLLACRAARPRRFQDMNVVPAPYPGVPEGRLNSSMELAGINSEILSRFGQAFPYRHGRHFLHSGTPDSGIFCAAGCPSAKLLSVNIFAEEASPALPAVSSSLYLRSTERAQQEMVKQFFGRLPPSTPAAEAVASLYKQLGDYKPPKPDSPLHPRIQITVSHLLTLPGEWDRLQYLAVFLVLHSQDVKFSDTNEFENVMRDVELGKLTRSLTSGVGLSSPLPSGASAAPSLTYSDALEQTLKEQLQFRASSIEHQGRVLAIVLKSSQADKLPTLVRQIVTLSYEHPEAGRGLVLSPAYNATELAALPFSDRVLRVEPSLAAGDVNPRNPSAFLTQATPVVVAVVRRVRNAGGISTSVEDDDKVDFVTQSEVLDPVTLHETPKCDYRLRGRNHAGQSIDVAILPPGEADAKPALFTSEIEVRKFMNVLIKRIADPQSKKTDGLVWEAAGSDLYGYRIVWTTDNAPLSRNSPDWTAIDPASLRPSAFCEAALSR